MIFKFKESLLDEIVKAANSGRVCEEIRMSRDEYNLLERDNRFNDHPELLIQMKEFKTIWGIPIKIEGE